MAYPLSSPVVEGQATEAAQYNNLRSDALYLGADPAASGTVRDLLYSAAGSLPLSASGTNTILLTASESAPAAVMINGKIYSVAVNLMLTLSAAEFIYPGRYGIYAVGQSDGSFILALTASGASREIGRFLWDGVGIIPGTVANLQELAIKSVADYRSADNGRLTLAAGDPVPSSDIRYGTEVYFTPYRGNLIGIYLFGQWEYFRFTTLSLNRNGMTVGLPYDIFITADRNGLHLEAGAWGSADERLDGSLQYIDGIRVSGVDSAYRYLGTVVLNADGYFEDSSTGRLLWNENNRINRRILAKLETSKSNGTAHENKWAPYYDEDAPFVSLLVPDFEVEFELTGVGCSSRITDSDMSYSRAFAIGILQDPLTESPYTGNESCVAVFTSSYGNGSETVTLKNYKNTLHGYHVYYLGYYSNHSFYPTGSSFKMVFGEYPGLYGHILA